MALLSMLFLKRQVLSVGMPQPNREPGLDGLHMSVITLSAVDFGIAGLADAEAPFVRAKRGAVNVAYKVYGN
ncbi:MAG: hypothetical protein JSR78_20355 [Proteobacteria bacterium]|nr:hypothetical protein [Pseudomonadota bacterium]